MAVFTFNPSSKGTNIVLVGSNHQVVSNSGSWQTARTTGGGLSSGKWYVEFLLSRRSSNGAMIGLTNASGPLNNYLGSDGNSFGWQCQGSRYGSISGAGGESVTHVAGDIVSVAFDVPNKRVWNRVNGGSWTGGGDPAAGTNYGTWSFSGDVYVAATVQHAGSSYVINSGSAPFAYTPPSGFSALGDSTSWTTSGTQKFDAGRIISSLVLSNSDLTATGVSDSQYGNIVAKVLHTSGKHYVEFNIDNSTGNAVVGLASAWLTPLVYEVEAAMVAGWQGNANKFGVAAPGAASFTFKAGDKVGLAWDADAKTVWIRKPDGTWLYGDPATGSGGRDVSAFVRMGAYPAPFVTILENPTAVTLNATGPFYFASPFQSTGRRRRVGLILEHSP